MISTRRAVSRLWTKLGKAPAIRTFRTESFGGIVQLTRPRALIFVDRQYLRNRGLASSPKWSKQESDGQVGNEVLSAPLEAHLQLTNRCDAGCQACYTAATPNAKREWGKEAWMKAIDSLATMGVFHLALGGGESADLPWLGELVVYARKRGLVPNLTTSGLSNLPRVLAIAHLFGQINVSMDGLRDDYQTIRGFDGFEQADYALQEIRKRTRHVGINTVVTKHNADNLEELFAYAKKLRLGEIELLRFKPAGRGISTYSDLVCSDAQHRAFLPTILKLSRRYRLRVRVDCSYTPMIAHHKPDPTLLRSLSVYGCTGGDFLIGAKAGGQVSACSFAPPPQEGPKVDELADYWQSKNAFGSFRKWSDNAQEPCRSCDYLSLCRGGCRVVSLHRAGSDKAPDPECPRVVDFRAQERQRQAPAPKSLPVLR